MLDAQSKGVETLNGNPGVESGQGNRCRGTSRMPLTRRLLRREIGIRQAVVTDLRGDELREYWLCRSTVQSNLPPDRLRMPPNSGQTAQCRSFVSEATTTSAPGCLGVQALRAAVVLSM